MPKDMVVPREANVHGEVMVPKEANMAGEKAKDINNVEHTLVPRETIWAGEEAWVRERSIFGDTS
jgi:hypothetical protein